MRDSIVFYRSFHEAIKVLPRRYRNELYPALIEYGLTGEEPEELSRVAQSIFMLCRPIMDSAKTRYESACRGGAPKGNDNARKQAAAAEAQAAEAEKQPDEEKTTENNRTAKTKQPKTTEKQPEPEKKQPNDNVDEDEDVNVDVNENKNLSLVSSRAKNTAALAAEQRESIYEIFFFNNYVKPDEEVNLFYDYYEGNGWRRSNGCRIDSAESISACARLWEQKGDKKHFETDLLRRYKRLYDESAKLGTAPDKLASMLHDIVSIEWEGLRNECIQLRCRKNLADMLRTNCDFVIRNMRANVKIIAVTE